MAIRKDQAAAKKRKVLRLSEEAFKTVEENANGIALALLDSTKKGRVMSARLLVELAEGNVDVEEGRTEGPLRSLALQLAMEAEKDLAALTAAPTAQTEFLKPQDA